MMNGSLITPRYTGKIFNTGISDSINLNGFDKMYEILKNLSVLDNI